MNQNNKNNNKGLNESGFLGKKPEGTSCFEKRAAFAMSQKVASTKTVAKLGLGAKATTPAAAAGTKLSSQSMVTKKGGEGVCGEASSCLPTQKGTAATANQ